MNVMSFLWRLLFRYRPWLYSSIILERIVFYAGQLLIGLILQSLFNQLSGQRFPGNGLWTLIALYFLIVLFTTGVSFIVVQATTRFSFAIMALLQRNIVQRILEQPGARAVAIPPGDAINRLSDDTMALNPMSAGIRNTIPLILFAIAAFVVLLRVSVQITLLVFLPVVGIVGIWSRISRHLNMAWKLL